MFQANRAARQLIASNECRPLVPSELADLGVGCEREYRLNVNESRCIEIRCQKW